MGKVDHLKVKKIKRVIEAATRGVFWKILFLKNLQKLHENTCATISFSIGLLKRDSGTAV